MGKQAGFLAHLCEDVSPTNYVLILSCFPIQLKHEVNSHISLNYNVILQGGGSSEEPLCTEDQALVSFSEAFSFQQSGNTENLYLKYVTVISCVLSLKLVWYRASRIIFPSVSWIFGRPSINSSQVYSCILRKEY